MAFQEGNTYWQYRKKHGRERIFESADDLLDQCIKYFEWVDNNQLKKAEVVKYKDHAELFDVPVCRVYTKEGLADFCQVAEYKTISNYRDRGDGFLQVITYVENVIYRNKFENAAAGLLNPNIIARDLGLAERTDNNTKQTIKVDISKQEIKDINDRLEESY